MNYRLAWRVYLALLAILLLVSSCTSPVVQEQQGQLRVVATTTIVGDVVKNVGGKYINLSNLIPVNVDEHAFEPSGQDLVKVARAQVVFMNGAGLEPFIEKLMQNAGGDATLASVSQGIPLLQSQEVEQEVDHAGKTHLGDPHIWTDPNNVMIWVDNIEKALTQADPAHASDYQQNAEAYRQQLRELDVWIRQRVESVAPDHRKLVTDHLLFTYFAKRYGFKQVGAVVPGYSTLAAPSAKELAVLEDTIRQQDVSVIFVGNTMNPVLANRIAQDTHVRLVQILTGSLTGPDGLAPTYIDYIHYNVQTIVSALKQPAAE